MRHFLKETDFSPHEIPMLFSMAADLKRLRNGEYPQPLAGQSWGMIFYKNSTRSRISFEVGIHELGGNVVRLDKSAMQISRGETIADTARVMSRYLHGLVVRAFGHNVIEEYASYATIPVVNALTDFLHPCQIYSDVFTLAEKFGGDGSNLESLRGRKLVFLGDCSSNMANSWLMAGAVFGMEVVLSGPDDFGPGQEIVDELARIPGSKPPAMVSDPKAAVEGADVLYTDVWVSMGDEAEEEKRIAAMRPFAATKELWRVAKPDSLFLHCMPTHPGLEVSDEVLADPRAVLFDQAENRLHMQKAILAELAEGRRDNV